MATLLYLLPGALLGAVLSYILPFIVEGLPYLMRASHEQRVIEGEWYSFHYTKQSDQPKIRKMRWSIRRHIRGGYTASCWDDTDSTHKDPINYGKGKAFLDRGHVILDLFSQKDHAHITCRILEPIATNEIGAGLWLSFDLDGTLIAGPIILTRQELAFSDAESELKSRVSAFPAYKILEVPTHSRVKGRKRPPEANPQLTN